MAESTVTAPSGDPHSVISTAAPATELTVYTDPTSTTLADRFLDGSLTVVTLFKEIAGLIPHAGPLAQVLGVTKELILVVNEMRDNRDGCIDLVERILRFIRHLAEELVRMNIPVQEGTPTAARLYALTLNIRAIKEDAEKWRDWKPWKRFSNRSAIKTGIARHGQHLSDCFQTFSVLTLLQLSTIADRGAALTQSGPSSENESAPQNTPTSPNTPEFSAGSSNDSSSLNTLLQQSAGRVIFGQIGRSVRSRGEHMGVDVGPSSDQPEPTSSGEPQPDSSKTHQVDTNTQYLATQVRDLRQQLDDIFPVFKYDDTSEGKPNFDVPMHIPQTGKPTRQFRQTIKAALDLLDGLEDGEAATYHARDFSGDTFKLSVNLWDLGLWDESLAVQTICVDLCRGLKLGNGESQLHATNLAMALNNLSIRLSQLGHLEEALRAIQEAAEIHRKLAHENPEIFNNHLGYTLMHLSICLSHLNRLEEALEIGRVSVDLRREIAAEKSDVQSQADLAQCLLDFSNRLSDLDRREEALQTMQEAADIYQQLDGAHPNVYIVDFGSALHNLSQRLADVGRTEEGLKVIQKAVDIRQRLEIDRPASFAGDLASSLRTLSLRFIDLDRPDEALEAAQKSVDIYRQLVTVRPALYENPLARSLNVLARCFSKLGRSETEISDLVRL